MCKEVKETTTVTLPDGDEDVCVDCLKEYRRKCREAFEIDNK